MDNIMTFQDIIQFLVSGAEPITDIEEIAVVMGVAPSTVYGYKNLGTDPKFSQTVALNKFLVTQKDCHIIEKVFCITRTARTNGRVQDDLWSIHKLTTDADRYFSAAQSGEPKAKQKYFDVIQGMKEELADLEAEGENL